MCEELVNIIHRLLLIFTFFYFVYFVGFFFFFFLLFLVCLGGCVRAFCVHAPYTYVRSCASCCRWQCMREWVSCDCVRVVSVYKIAYRCIGWNRRCDWLVDWLVGSLAGIVMCITHFIMARLLVYVACVWVCMRACICVCPSLRMCVCVCVVSYHVSCCAVVWVRGWLVGWLVRLVELLLNWCFLVARALYRFNGLPIVYILIHSKQHTHTCTRLDSNRKLKRRARDGKETDVYLYIYGHSRAPRARDLSTIFQHFRAIICFLICDII